MKSLFKSQELWDLVEFGYTESTLSDQQLSENRKKDAKALFLLQTALDDVIFPRISAANTSHEAWEILKHEYLTSQRLVNVCLQSHFAEMDMRDDESVQTYLSRVSEIVSQLRSYGESMSSDMIVSKVLRSLNAKFDYTSGDGIAKDVYTSSFLQERDGSQKVDVVGKGLMSSPLPVLHRAEKKYEVGAGQRTKQRRVTAILNKLTSQNSEKLSKQIIEVNINNVVTLSGVISQIFNMALVEPPFCGMYAGLCQHLASELPDLRVDNERITFRRLLLNKCQEEFERGERKDEGVYWGHEGETKQSEQVKEEKILNAQRRMFGNIRLMGELYKKRMLTERIMHECIKKLLGRYHNPDEENIKALCMLMSTIGEMIDHPKAKEHMDGYFDIMGKLSINMKLSLRLRFLLKDTIDLRKNRWQQRRNVEGPEKIEEVCRAAAQERQGQTSWLTRGPNMNSTTRRGSNRPSEYAPRAVGGYRGVRSQFRGHAGFARVMSGRGQPSVSTGPTADYFSFHRDSIRRVDALNDFRNKSDSGCYISRDDQLPKHEGRLREMSMAVIKEYYSAKDVKEAELCVKELNAPSYYPTVISMWVTDSFEIKDTERNLLTKLLVTLTKPREGTFSTQQLIQGFESLLTDFEDTVIDAPRAPEFLGRMFGTFILENVLPLQDVCRLINQGHLLEARLAADVLGNILDTIKSEKGDDTLNDIRTSSNLRLEDYVPPKPRKSKKLEMFL